jgi:microsomal dipeptidase-like Zn-dependent dipeptidase
LRFIKSRRHPFTDTSRKRAALRRKQRLEREALPLFAEQIAEEQPREDEVMDARAVQWARNEKRSRLQRAELWRKARRRLSSLRDNERRVLLHAWNSAPYPAHPVYLLDFLHSFGVGRFTLDAIPFDLVPRNAHGHRLP